MAADSSIRLSAPQSNLHSIVPPSQFLSLLCLWGSAHSSNGNHGASRKRLKLWQLTNSAIGEVRQNWRMLYKLPSVGRFPDGLLLFVNIFLNDDLRDCTCSTMFPANAVR